MNVLGLDIGGANIKAADADGRTDSRAFAMWTECDRLADVLGQIPICRSTNADLIALTMTAELADCFATKADGVQFVISAVVRAFPGIPVRVWLTSGEFAEADDARELPELAAAANWHALATWAGRAVPAGPALLIDIGSTTTDMIPLLDGRPLPEGHRDHERLLSGELLYSGIWRTPVCAVVRQVPLRGRLCPVAAEVFATMADVFLLGGLVQEDPGCADTANGRPLTRADSFNRLAHMVCCDSTELDQSELLSMAEYVMQAQMEQLTRAAEQVLQRLSVMTAESGDRSGTAEEPVVLLSGSGVFLARRLADALGAARFGGRMDLTQMFSHDVSESACAFAVARLAHDLCRDDLLETSQF